MRRSLRLAIALAGVVLVNGPTKVHGQTSNSVQASGNLTATVSVQELQISAKSRNTVLKGIECLRKGEAQRGLSYFEQAIQASPKYRQAYYQKGLAQVRLDQAGEALKSFQKALDLSNGHYALAYFGYGQALAKLGRFEDAETMLRQGLQEDSSMAEGYIALSLVLINQHRLDDAEDAAQKALHTPDPFVWKAHLSLACIDAYKGQYQSAVQHMDAYLQQLRASGEKGFLPAVERARGELAARIATQESGR